MGVRFFAERDPREGLLLRAAGAAENPAVRRRRTAFWSMTAKLRPDSRRKPLALRESPAAPFLILFSDKKQSLFIGKAPLKASPIRAKSADAVSCRLPRADAP